MQGWGGVGWGDLHTDEIYLLLVPGESLDLVYLLESVYTCFPC